MTDIAFVICQVGLKESAERRWADELFEYVIEPEVNGHGLRATRSDLDVTPGQITVQIVHALTRSKVVVADLTGGNPNVYYELGIAHSFGIPVVIMVDTTGALPFDMRTERVIEIGRHSGSLSVRDAQESRKKLDEALDVVLQEDYQPKSLVSEAANVRSLDRLASTDPVADEISSLRVELSQVAKLLAEVADQQLDDRRQLGEIRDRLAHSPQLGQRENSHTARVLGDFNKSD